MEEHRVSGDCVRGRVSYAALSGFLRGLENQN